MKPTKPRFKHFLVLALFFFASALSFAQATITIEVEWPNWSSENRVQFRDPSNNVLGSICDLSNCFNGGTNSAYSTVGSGQVFNGVAYGTNYDLRLQDDFGDGWNGTSFVRVYQDGVLILTTDLANGETDPKVVSFDINAPTPALSVTNPTVDENAGTLDFVVTTVLAAASGPFTVNYQTINGTATGGGVDYTTNTGTLNFTGALNDTETVTVQINDDGVVESSENFQIIFTFSSDNTVNISNTGTATIDDDDTIIITDGGMANACGGSFFDSGSIFGQYGNNEDSTFTICPDSPSNDINIVFPTFNLESGFDFLRVYQGTSTAGTLIGTYDDANPPPTNITSSDASGCLTFRFTSDGSQVRNGWEGVISCVPKAAQLAVEDVVVDEDAGTLTFTVEHFGIAASGPYTVTYNTVTGTAGATDYTEIIGGTLNFDGTLGDSEQIIVSITDDFEFGEGDETFTIQFTSTTDTAVNITDIATGTIQDNEVIPVNAPLTLFNEFNGYYDYALTGGSMRTSDTDVCAIATSSSNTLTTSVPATANIEQAYLFWTHSGVSPDTNVTFEGQNVSAFAVNQSNFGGSIFSMMGDVTALVSGITNLSTNSFDFSDLNVDNGDPWCSSTVVVGGWSLMVFYTDDSLPAVSINLYQGFDGQQNNTTSYTLDGFFAIGASGAKTSVLSWEGDIGLANNELLSLTTSSGTTTLSGDGNNDGSTVNNPFNSTLYDNTASTTVNTTTFGLDLDTYDISSLISAGESTATTNVGVGQDFVMLNAVLLKVPSNLIVGNVFEDVNYGGGFGRDMAVSGGIGVNGARVELYDSSNVFQEAIDTDANGVYSFGGMANGSYSIRVVNNTVNSTRGGGAACSACLPVQTFLRNYANGSGFSDIDDRVGGLNPADEDVGSNTLTNAKTVSTVNIISEGVVGLDFGFNFNTVVNTNEDGQGSLEQFIVNANALDASGIDIVANSIFDPAPGDDTSIFMIPPISDLLGRTADSNFSSGYFDINIPNGSPLSEITGPNIVIDGRTQTAYSGDTNSGTVGAGGTAVGTSSTNLQNFDLPEIQVHRNNGDVFQIQGDNDVIRNLAVYASQRTAILFDDGSGSTVSNSLIGVNALGVNAGSLSYGVAIEGTTVTNPFVNSNYIATTSNAGVFVNGGTGTKTIQGNHIFNIGNGPCDLGIDIRNGSDGVLVQNNLIEDSQGIGVKSTGGSGGVDLIENTITGSGQNTGTCTGDPDDFGISMIGSNNQVVNNVIYENGGAGLVLNGSNTSGNLISRNSFYNNGINGDALGIDLNEDGVTLNDSGDTDSGPNGSINFPIIETAYKSGSNVVVSGWSRPGATIEFFLTDINQGSATAGDNQLGFSVDYGEGQVFLASLVEGSGSDSNSNTSVYTDDDGNTDNTNKFTFTFPVAPGVVLGDDLTATATIANTTSEFSPFSKLKAFTIITNRRITYRVKKD